MNRIESHIYFLRYLSVATSYQRRHLLQTATAEQLSVLYEITFNILQGNISLSDEDYSRLYKNRNTLRKLSLKEVDRYTKKQLLGKHSCAVRDLLQIFFHYYSPTNTENPITFLPCTESEEEESEEDSEEEVEEEEEESVERPVFLNECETELESDHGRPERIQDINTHTPVALPTTAETSSESRDTPTSKPTESKTQETI